MTDRTLKQIEKVVAQFKAKQPKNLEAVENMDYTLKPIGDGAYRTVYKIGNLPIVVKVPTHTGGSCKRHAIAEWRAVQRILKFKKYIELQPFVPKIYYFDPKSGIMIVHYYKPAPVKYRRSVSMLFERYLPRIWALGYRSKWSTVDTHRDNIAIDEEGVPKLIDLGYFSQYGK